MSKFALSERKIKKKNAICLYKSAYSNSVILSEPVVCYNKTNIMGDKLLLNFGAKFQR